MKLLKKMHTNEKRNENMYIYLNLSTEECIRKCGKSPLKTLIASQILLYNIRCLILLFFYDTKYIFDRKKISLLFFMIISIDGHTKCYNGSIHSLVHSCVSQFAQIAHKLLIACMQSIQLYFQPFIW